MQIKSTRLKEWQAEEGEKAKMDKRDASEGC